MDEELLLEDVELDEALFSEFDDDDDPDEMFDVEAYEAIEEDDDDDDGDESFEDEAYDAEFIGPVLGALAPALAPSLVSAGGRLIGRLFSGGRRSPRRYRRMAPLPAPRGVRSAILRTPRGTARLRLPTAVMPRSEAQRIHSSLRKAINQNTNRINKTQRDLHTVRRQATAGVAANRRDLARLRKAERRNRKALAKLRQEQSARATTNLLMTMMMQRQIQDRIDDHTHTVSDVTKGSDSVTTAAPTTSDSDNNMLMLLPLLMQQGGSGGDNSMMMMAMMMAMQD